MSVFNTEVSVRRESNKGSKERQGPTISVCFQYRGVRLIESQIKGVKKGKDQL